MKYSHLKTNSRLPGMNFSILQSLKSIFEKKAHASMDFLKKCDEKQVFILERPYWGKYWYVVAVLYHTQDTEGNT